MYSNRKKRFIVAAFVESGQGKGEFDWCAVAKKLGITDDEARDTTFALAKDKVFIGLGYGSTTALFTATGSDLARDSIDEGFGEGLES